MQNNEQLELDKKNIAMLAAYMQLAFKQADILLCSKYINHRPKEKLNFIKNNAQANVINICKTFKLNLEHVDDLSCEIDDVIRPSVKETK